MPIEHINKTDTLNEGREKLNASIDGANAADVTSKAADTKASQALAKSTSTQTQLDTIVIDGDSSVEAAQARVDEKGDPHPTLKARIDDGMNSVNQQLAQTSQEIETKMDKTTYDIGVGQINKNKGKLDQTYMSDEFLQQIAGNTPINAVPADGSLGYDKTNFLKTNRVNLFDKNATEIGVVSADTGEVVYVDGYQATDFIEITPGETYNTTRIHAGAYYDINKVFISGLNGGGVNNTLNPPTNAAYMRLTIKDDAVDGGMIVKGELPSEYVPYDEYDVEILDTRFARSIEKTIEPQVITFNAYRKEKNLFNKETVNKARYVNGDNGNLENSATTIASDFIPVKGSTEYFITQGRTRNHAFYDVNKNYISSSNTDTGNPLISPPHARYLRISLVNAALDLVQVEEGNVGTAFEPYSNYRLQGLSVSQQINELVYGKMDVVVPKKIYALVDGATEIFYRNIVNGNLGAINVDIEGDGTPLDNRWQLINNLGNYKADIILRDVNFNGLIKKTLNVEVLSKTTPTRNVYLLPIGDSITNLNTYSKHVQETLMNVQTVGTRTHDDGLSAMEGRPGWTAAQYILDFGKTNTLDSPFLFPNGIEGTKYKGNTANWKNICYTNPTNYQFEGFQKIAKGWNGTDYLFDENGYLINPSIGDVMYDPSLGFVEYNGTSWQVMSIQPGVEFSFAKYMERFSPAFPNGVTHVSFLLGTNDFAALYDIEIPLELYIGYLTTMINSIKGYDSTIKVIINIPMVGSGQDAWGTQRGTSGAAELFRQNMQRVGRRILGEWDNDSAVSQGVYVCAMNAFLNTENLSDSVHPNDAGLRQIGNALASVVQATR